MSEIIISEEALLCSHREESHSHPHGYHVQLLLNQRDAELAVLKSHRDRLRRLIAVLCPFLESTVIELVEIQKATDDTELFVLLKKFSTALTASQAGVKGEK